MAVDAGASVGVWGVLRFRRGVTEPREVGDGPSGLDCFWSDCWCIGEADYAGQAGGGIVLTIVLGIVGAVVVASLAPGWALVALGVLTCGAWRWLLVGPCLCCWCRGGWFVVAADLPGRGVGLWEGWLFRGQRLDWVRKGDSDFLPGEGLQACGGHLGVDVGAHVGSWGGLSPGPVGLVWGLCNPHRRCFDRMDRCDVRKRAQAASLALALLEMGTACVGSGTLPPASEVATGPAPPPRLPLDLSGRIAPGAAGPVGSGPPRPAGSRWRWPAG